MFDTFYGYSLKLFNLAFSEFSEPPIFLVPKMKNFLLQPFPKNKQFSHSRQCISLDQKYTRISCIHIKVTGKLIRKSRKPCTDKQNSIPQKEIQPKSRRITEKFSQRAKKFFFHFHEITHFLPVRIYRNFPAHILNFSFFSACFASSQKTG